MGCFRRILLLVILVAIVVAAWLFRDRIIGLWQDYRGADEPVLASPELAERAERRLATLNGPDAPARVSLNGAELQSLVTYRMAASLPSFVLDPVVTVDEGDLRVSARVPTDEVARVPGVGGSEEILGMLPDTTDVQAKAHLIPIGTGRVGLAVDEVSAASIPLPSRAIPRILDAIGRRDEPGLPTDALGLRLPDGVASVYVDGDSIVFVSRDASSGD